MSSNFNTNTKNNDEWLTPPSIIKSLGDFDLDPCSPIDRPWDTAAKHFSEPDDGLSQPWEGRVWCNPPYGRETFAWIDKLATHGNGIALIFARTETKGFHRQIWERADAILFLEGRIKFHYVDGSQADSANAPSCLVAYGGNNAESLARSGIKGKIVYL